MADDMDFMGGWTYEMEQIFLQDLEISESNPGTAAHQRRMDKLVVAATAVADFCDFFFKKRLFKKTLVFLKKTSH